MSETATLAVELVTEELPPKSLKALGEVFASALADGLRKREFLSAEMQVAGYATPRRLAVVVTHVRRVAPDATVLDKLMPAKVAWDAQGHPSQAYAKKLGAMGRAHLATASREVREASDRIFVKSDGKADYVYLESLAKGQPLERGVQDALEAAIASLPIPKVMRYANPDNGYYNEIAFVRPAHRLLVLHGARVLDVSVLGLRADRLTDGHRFLSRRGIPVANADAWAPTIEAEGKVVPSFAQRRALIEAELAKAAQGDRVIAPGALLDEVTALVEWPVVVAGTFDPAFLAVPQECLILTMQQNQKYFALTDAQGRMRSRFLVVSNLATEDSRAIAGGNERVLRARLADARFFFDQDRKSTLESRVPRLANVVYLAKLGNHARQIDRVDRLRRLAGALAPRVGANPLHAERAALLAKADLTTDMVGEFPELQGTMGRYYAIHDGEHADVADAIAQHYWPRFAGDALPAAPVALAVSLADKLESLAALFGLGQLPSGDKDPFGLRRAAIGIVRVLIEKRLDLSLRELADVAFGVFAPTQGFVPVPDALVDFITDRLRGYLREQGGTANQVEALLAAGAESLVSMPDRLAAVRAFESLPEAQALAAANKRIVNILRKSGSEAAPEVDAARLADGAERELFDAFATLAPQVEARSRTGDWAGALKSLSTVKPVVDRFFDDVMVMADDAAVRANRLALLRQVSATMNRVADISKLAV
jgi:glycyl-tRNA synthetase beta chain